MQSKSVSHTSLESAGIIALTLFLSLSAWARSETVLHNFAGGPDGAFPRASLIFDSAGHLYGTTQGGGAGDFGTVFKLAFTGTRWTERVLYRFTGGTDGSTPVGGVAMDKAGNLYGTTLYGGTYGYGTVFKLTASRPGWTETVLYSFKGSADGIYPFAGVTLDAAGNLYGTTYAGGLGRCSQENNGCGTVFELTNTGGWTHTILYLFPGGTNGGFPLGGVIFDHAGNLYGMTEYGGSSFIRPGTVYKLSPSGGSFTHSLIHQFTDTPDGAFPYGNLTFDQAGNLYGTTGGGGLTGHGTVFELTPSGNGWTESVLYSFAGGSDGFTPFSGVTIDPAGNLYGTTYYGGTACRVNSCGTLFELTSSGGIWTKQTLYSFGGGNDGRNPDAGVILDDVGNLYGTTENGGSRRNGVVFEIQP